MSILSQPSSATSDTSLLLRDWRVGYGPPELLTRFMLTADAACRAVGLTLSFATFEDLFEANQRNSDSWYLLNSMFDYRNGMLTPDTSFCVIAKNAAGEVVASHAARYYDWSNTTMRAEAESLRMCYRDPEAMKNPGETITVRTDVDQVITGRVVFSGAAWIRPDFRGKRLSAIIPKIAKTVAFTRYSPDIICGWMADTVFASGFAPRFDYPNVNFEVKVANARWGDYRMAVVWMEGLYLLSSLDSWLLANDANHAGERQGSA